MPPRRTSTRNSQATLSFGANRVTKPTPTTAHKNKSVDSPAQAQAQQAAVTPIEPSEPHVAEKAVRQQAEKESVQPWSEDELQAAKLTEGDLRRYWNAEEKSRKAPRVHQEEISLREKILRHFDLSSQYGPCIGIARVKRWRRAKSLDLHPPLEVLAVLLQGEEQGVRQRAYVDELMS